MEVLHLDLPNVAPMRRQAASLRSPFKAVLKWPNELGDVPVDALGKHVMMDTPQARGEYSVDAVEGDALLLSPFPG